MKFTSHEEYGLRCLLQIGRLGAGESVTIPQISEAEGMSTAYVAKLLRLLRLGGFVKSARGLAGGYTLAQPPERVIVGDVLDVLGGRLFESDFCERHAGSEQSCAHSVDCSIRSLWRTVQVSVDRVLRHTTLKDLLRNEDEMSTWVTDIAGASNTQTNVLCDCGGSNGKFKPASNA